MLLLFCPSRQPPRPSLLRTPLPAKLLGGGGSNASLHLKTRSGWPVCKDLFNSPAVLSKMHCKRKRSRWMLPFHQRAAKMANASKISDERTIIIHGTNTFISIVLGGQIAVAFAASNRLKRLSYSYSPRPVVFNALSSMHGIVELVRSFVALKALAAVLFLAPFRYP